jgi:hypothetical protein
MCAKKVDKYLLKHLKAKVHEVLLHGGGGGGYLYLSFHLESSNISPIILLGIKSQIYEKIYHFTVPQGLFFGNHKCGILAYFEQVEDTYTPKNKKTIYLT